MYKDRTKRTKQGQKKSGKRKRLTRQEFKKFAKMFAEEFKALQEARKAFFAKVEAYKESQETEAPAPKKAPKKPPAPKARKVKKARKGRKRTRMPLAERKKFAKMFSEEFAAWKAPKKPPAPKARKVKKARRRRQR